LATATYECLFLFDSNRYARDPGGCSAAIQDAITNVGGEILVSRLWAEQKLAYPVNGHQKGTYWLIYFHVDTLRIKELNRTFQLNESLLRWLFTRIDPRLVEALVAHAKGKAALPRPEIVIEDDEAVAVGAGVSEEGEDFEAEAE
jgi:small subunit ribosomal protein S6